MPWLYCIILWASLVFHLDLIMVSFSSPEQTSSPLTAEAPPKVKRWVWFIVHFNSLLHYDHCHIVSRLNKWDGPDTLYITTTATTQSRYIFLRLLTHKYAPFLFCIIYNESYGCIQFMITLNWSAWLISSRIYSTSFPSCIFCLVVMNEVLLSCFRVANFISLKCFDHIDHIPCTLYFYC